MPSAGSSSISSRLARATPSMPSAKIFGVRPADIRHHADLRFGDPRQLANLARMIHSHFDHGGPAIVGQTQNRQRHAEVIVVVADGAAGAELHAQQARDGVFGGGLAGASGDADHRSAPALSRLARQLLQRGQRVRHHQLQDFRVRPACSTIASAAPFRARCRRNRARRASGPRSAKKQSPGLTVRLSMLQPETAALRHRRRRIAGADRLRRWLRSKESSDAPAPRLAGNRKPRSASRATSRSSK